jgi:hypothetical protein
LIAPDGESLGPAGFVATVEGLEQMVRVGAHGSFSLGGDPAIARNLGEWISVMVVGEVIVAIDRLARCRVHWDLCFAAEFGNAANRQCRHRTKDVHHTRFGVANPSTVVQVRVGKHRVGGGTDVGHGPREEAREKRDP